MARSLNKVMLLGNLGGDPEVRYTASGKAVATFTMATSMEWKDGDGTKQEKTEWHRVVVWGRLGEVCGEYLKKGQKVYVEGRIQTREWEDADSNKHRTTEIVVNDMIMLGGGQGNGGQQQSGGNGNDSRRNSGQQNRSGSGNSRNAYGPPPPEDDIPF